MESHEVIQDFRRRYENTYVWLKMEEQQCETLVHVDSVTDSNTKMAVLTLSSAEYGQLGVNFGSSDHTLKFKYPPVGVFQAGDTVLCFTRRPARQYRRGLCADNSTMNNIGRNIIGNMTRWTMDNVAAAFKHETKSVEDAYSLLKDNKKLKGVALPNEFSLIRNMTSVQSKSDLILFHWQQPLAFVSPEGKLVKLLESYYERAVNEHCS